MYIEAREKIAPEHYILDRTSHGVHIDPYDPAIEDDPVLIITNEARVALRIIKYDRVSGTWLSGVTFEIYKDAELFDTKTMNENGEINLYDLELGTYLAKEVSSDDAHIVTTTPQQIELKAGQTATQELVFFNDLKPGIHLIKEDSITHARLANVRFQVWYASNSTATGEINDLGVYTANENGRIELDGTKMGKLGLRDGWFRVKELAPPKGYSIKDSDTQETFVPPGRATPSALRTLPCPRSASGNTTA